MASLEGRAESLWGGDIPVMQAGSQRSLTEVYLRLKVWV